MFRRMMILAMVFVFAVSSTCLADTVIDTIMGIGTAQAFTDEAVSVDDLKTIMEAGLAAASAINQQPWFFVAIRDKELMKELSGSGASFTPPAGDSGKPEGAPKEGSGGFPGAPASGGNGFPGAPASGSSGFPGAPASGSSAKAGLGDSPAVIIIYRSDATKSPNANFDCGLATQNMVVAAASLGYGVKIVSSPTSALNGPNHDAICEKLGVDTSMQAVAVLLIGRQADTIDAVSGATTRDSLESKTTIIE